MHGPSVLAGLGVTVGLAIKGAASEPSTPATPAAALIGKKHGSTPPTTTTTTTTASYRRRRHPVLPAAIGSTAGATRIPAIDCEMVGVGPGGVRSALARVCLVDAAAGACCMDVHVSPRERATDNRAHVSGVAPFDLRGAPDLDTVRERVKHRIIAGRTLVGHAIAHDLARPDDLPPAG